jgi:hypothetical protein
LVLWDPEEAPTLFFKGSKPGAATAGWSLFLWARFDIARATRASQWRSIGSWPMRVPLTVLSGMSAALTMLFGVNAALVIWIFY